MLLLQCDLKQAAAVERRRRFEEERRQRIFNPRWRLIGIDKSTIDKQIQERRLQTDAERRLDEVFDQQRIQNDKLALSLEQELEKGRRQKNKELNEYRLRFQNPESRREFDLYDPNALKKALPARVDDEDPRCCPSSAQKFQGEDLASPARIKAQKEQSRAWLEQQMFEKKRIEDEKKMTEKAFDEAMITIDKKASEIERLEEQCKRSLNATILQYNKSLAQERSLVHDWERRRDEADKETEIHNSIVGDLLCENREVHMSNLGPNRVLGSMYKGMSAEERVAVRNEQLRQIEEKQRKKSMEAELERQWSILTESIAQKMFLKEREIIVKKRNIDQSIVTQNLELAREQKARQYYLEKNVYVDQPTEEYYDQFNTTTR